MPGQHKHVVLGPTYSTTESMYGKGNNNSFGSTTLGPHCLKVILLGGAQVGKSSIVQRILGNDFSPEYVPTVYEYHETRHRFEGRTLSLTLIDTAGHYNFPAMRKLSIALSEVYVFVYSFDNRRSVEELHRIYNEIYSMKGSSDFPLVVLGNKTDLMVKSKEEVRKAAVKSINCWGCPHVEVSAKDAECFSDILDLIIDQVKVEDIEEKTHSKKSKLKNLGRKLVYCLSNG